MKKKEHQNHVFLEALILAIFIFLIGILLGFLIESSRVEKISDLYLKSETNLLDIQVQTKLLDSKDIDCEFSIEKNIEFGNKIYNEAKLLSKYEAVSKLTNSLKEQHRRYDMLRVLFWINSIKLKETCKEAPSTVVYLYNFEPTSLNEKSQQKVISNYLMNVKEKYGNDFMLIPIARDLDLVSLEILTREIKQEGPVIIINEEFLIDNIHNLNKITDYLENRSKF